MHVPVAFILINVIITRVCSMSQISYMKIVRSGEFPLRTYGKNHCGTSSHFLVKYHMIALCDPKLDHRGFLFDQLNIDKFFHGIKSTSCSCERLTEKTLVKLKKFISEREPGMPNSCHVSHTFARTVSGFYDIRMVQ